MQGWIAKDAAATQSSSAPAALGGWLCDAHQHTSCRPTNPANGDITINQLNWPYTGPLKLPNADTFFAKK